MTRSRRRTRRDNPPRCLCEAQIASLQAGDALPATHGRQRPEGPGHRSAIKMDAGVDLRSRLNRADSTSDGYKADARGRGHRPGLRARRLAPAAGRDESRPHATSAATATAAVGSSRTSRRHAADRTPMAVWQPSSCVLRPRGVHRRGRSLAFWPTTSRARKGAVIRA